MGLEPIRSYEHYHLKVACLPIPALSHMVGKVGLEPTTAEATDLQSAAIPITLYLPILINTSPIL